MDGIIAHLDLSDCRVLCLSLFWDEKTRIHRLRIDIASGLRDEDGIIERATERLALYQNLKTQKLDNSALTIAQTAGALGALLAGSSAVSPLFRL